MYTHTSTYQFVKSFLLKVGLESCLCLLTWGEIVEQTIGNLAFGEQSYEVLDIAVCDGHVLLEDFCHHGYDGALGNQPVIEHRLENALW